MTGVPRKLNAKEPALTVSADRLPLRVRRSSGPRLTMLQGYPYWADTVSAMGRPELARWTRSPTTHR